MSESVNHPHGQSSPYDYIKNNPKIFKWIVEGIPVVPGEELPVRRDINELVASKAQIDQDQVNLFLLGMKQFQERFENDPKSYFMMAASQYKDEDSKKRYQAAAKIWRLPYWDPAKITDEKVYNGVSIPSLVTWPFRDVQDTDGNWKSIVNPFYSYVFHKGKGPEARLDEMVTEDVDYSKLKTTARQPYATHIGLGKWMDSPVDVTKVDEWRNMQVYLNDRQPHQNQNNYHIVEIFREDISFRQSVYDCLIFNKHYTRMASTGFVKRQEPDGKARTEVSLESVHNTVHNYSGGVGQMGDVPVAAFDPIFWFHHANIDRWYAMWEKLNPGAWWTKEDAKEQEETADPNDPVHGPDDQGPDSKLFPFYETNEKAWTATSMKERNLNFGYTYDDLSGSSDELTKRIGVLYNGLAKDLRRPPIRQALKEIYKEPVKPDEIFFYDYRARVTYEKFALNGQAYTIHLFIGDFDAKDPKSWSTARAHLGSIFNFASPAPLDKEGGCENCKAKRRAGQILVGSVSMTQAVIQGIQDPQLKDEVIKLVEKGGPKEFFDKYFTWKLTTRDGKEVINVEKIMPSFEVEIFRRQGTVKADEDNYEPPKYADFKSIWKSTEITTHASCNHES
ncbi:hypothetical protein TWF281_006324 [Arthrobotrys megalospora]